MKLVFFHYGEKIKRDISGNYYTDGSYHNEVWSSYLAIFTEVTLVMRFDSTIYSQEEAQSKFNIIPDYFNVVELPDKYRSLKTFLNYRIRLEMNRVIEQAVSVSDAVIVGFYGAKKAADYAKKYDKQCLVEVVGCPLDAMWNFGIKGKLLAIPQYIGMKTAVKKAPNVIYVTEKFLQKRYPTKGRNIGCSDVRLSNLDKGAIKVGEKNTGRFVIGTAAAVNVKYKGQQYVIKALAQLKKRGINNIEYQLAGNGNADYLRNLAEKCNVIDQVRFLGNIPHSKIFDWYNSLDLYIQPSNQEGLPRALVEAMSCSLPCIGSNAGGIPELLDEDVIFKKRNVRELIAIVQKMLNPDYRENQGKKNYQKSLEYDSKKLEDKRLKFMKSIFCEKQL